jgi:hypothetical protein
MREYAQQQIDKYKKIATPEQIEQTEELLQEQKNSFDLEDFFIKINELMKILNPIIFNSKNLLENIDDVITYKLIGNNGETIEEDISFNNNLKRCFAFLYFIKERKGIENPDISSLGDLDDILESTKLSNLNLGILKRYNYMTINDGEGEVSGIEYTINENENKLRDDNTLAIIPLLLGIIVAFHINNKDMSEDKKFYTITLSGAQGEQQGEEREQQGGKNKKNKKGAKQNIKPTKPTKPTITGKKEILGKERCIYKKAGDRKEYVKYKGDLITIKDYKKIISLKKQKK